MLANNNQQERVNIFIKELETRIPHVSDKALIDLINGIQVNQNILSYRKSRGFFGKLLDNLTGSDRDRQLLLDGNLIVGQQTLHNWVLELTDSLKISQSALQITQKSLLEARNAIRINKSQLQHQELAIIEFADQLEQIVQQVDKRFKAIEARIHQLETKVAANEDLDFMITAWEANQTYYDLPWLIQIIFLVKEIYSSAVIIYELETQDKTKYRQLIINKILASSTPIARNFFSLAEFLDLSSQEIKTTDLELCAGMLETRSLPLIRLDSRPLLFAVGTILELAQLPREAQPRQLGTSAIALCRQEVNYLPHQMDTRELVTTIVNEIADDSLSQLIACQNNFKSHE